MPFLNKKLPFFWMAGEKSDLLIGQKKIRTL